jgi:hypothetical protein
MKVSGANATDARPAPTISEKQYCTEQKYGNSAQSNSQANS